MFCGKCGMKNSDNAMFCSGCGAELNSAQMAGNNPAQMYGNNPTQMHGNNQAATVMRNPAYAASPDGKNRKKSIILIAAIAVIAIALVAVVFGGRSYEKTIDKYVEATYEGDVETILELIPKKAMLYALEDEGYHYDELDEFIEDASEEMEYQLDRVKDYIGDNWKITHEIVYVEDILGDDLEYLQDDYEELDIDVSAAKNVKVGITIKVGEDEYSNSMHVSVIKVGRSWYLDLDSMGSLF